MDGECTCRWLFPSSTRITHTPFDTLRTARAGHSVSPSEPSPRSSFSKAGVLCAWHSLGPPHRRSGPLPEWRHDRASLTRTRMREARPTGRGRAPLPLGGGADPRRPGRGDPGLGSAPRNHHCGTPAAVHARPRCRPRAQPAGSRGCAHTGARFPAESAVPETVSERLPVQPDLRCRTSAATVRSTPTLRARSLSLIRCSRA